MAMNEQWHIFVFSYNRGIFLQNCLESLKHCADGIDVTIIDDNSDDESTKTILASIPEKFGFELVHPQRQGGKEKRLGGLYSNMNFALKIAKNNDKSFCIFIQDDMQFVRSIQQDDLLNMQNIFHSDEHIIQIQSCFMKAESFHAYEQGMVLHESLECYSWKGAPEGKWYFSDVGVFNIAAFEKHHNTFAIGENLNNEIAQANKTKLVQYRKPFMMWLPFPKSYLRKNTKWKTRIIEKIAGCGFYPIEIFDHQQEQALSNNPKSTYPIAEHFLKVKGLEKYKIWGFSAGIINWYARGGIRRLLALLIWRMSK
ncbi:glycosyltransferase family A protein [Glaciecola sp. 1036]|uniref:glycosyltransferase family A protein n=1 Tax=Alteromonadaceae TaxID=72275 RepID=UPI003CFFD8ED